MADLSAGLTVGVIALPLAMAFAIGSGVAPGAGITTAIVAGFLISALGGTRLAIGGPTGAFIVIVYGIVDRYGLANLIICTMLAGAMLFAMGALRFGGLIRFVPQPVIVGFTNGIAVLILLAQVRDFFGLSVEKVPAEFFSMIRVLASSISSAQPSAFLLATACLVVMRAWPASWAKRAPAAVVVLVGATVLVAVSNLPVETIGSRFGSIPRSLPMPTLPSVGLEHLRDLIVPSFTIALLAAIESLLCAVVADKMTRDRHDANQELMAQGIANFASGLFGGIPATGAIARTTANIRTGGWSPLAGMIHAATLLGIVLLAAPLASGVPLAALSAILVSVAIGMGEWNVFREFPTYAPSRSLKLFSVFFVTVVFDLTIAVELGMLISALVLIAHIAEITEVRRIHDTREEVAHFGVFGALFFGAAEKLEAIVDEMGGARVALVDLTRTIYVDTTAVAAFENLHARLGERGRRLIIYGATPQPARVLGALALKLGARSIVPDRALAFARTEEMLNAAADQQAADERPSASPDA